MNRRRIDWLEVILFLLGGLLALLIFISVIVIAYPKTGDRAVRNVRDSFEAAFGYDPQAKVTDFFLTIGKRARQGWEQRITKIPDKIKLFKVERKPLGEKLINKDELAKEFAECKKCHKDFLERRVFKNIYLDHRSHLAKGANCYDCHKDNRHPKPQKTKEKECLDCHKKQDDTVRLVENCETCHTPGSIFNSAKGDTPKIQKFLASRSITSVMPEGFEHGKTEACNKCHNAPEFCNKCHMVFHDKLPNWLNDHGPRILAQKYQIQGCKQCHKATWCATKCHPNPGRQRVEGKKQLPIIPIDNYIQ